MKKERAFFTNILTKIENSTTNCHPAFLAILGLTRPNPSMERKVTCFCISRFTVKVQNTVVLRDNLRGNRESKPGPVSFGCKKYLRHIIKVGITMRKSFNKSCKCSYICCISNIKALITDRLPGLFLRCVLLLE